MLRANLNRGEPVKNCQHFLRLISYYYKEVPAVIPDGIFGAQTKLAVEGFQKRFGLKVTGEVNEETWNNIISIYRNIIGFTDSNNLIFPTYQKKYAPGENGECLYVIQSMMCSIAGRFTNLGSLDVTGTQDEKSVNVTKNIQKICNIPCSGIIDVRTFNNIFSMYSLFITKNI